MMTLLDHCYANVLASINRRDDSDTLAMTRCMVAWTVLKNHKERHGDSPVVGSLMDVLIQGCLPVATEAQRQDAHARLRTATIVAETVRVTLTWAHGREKSGK